MSVFLATVEVAVWRASPQEFDSHGWAEQSPRTLVGTWPGNVQHRIPLSDPRAAEGGGAGPYSPDVSTVADLILDPHADVTAGDLCHAGDEWWRVGSVRPMPGPLSPLGSTLVADVTLVSAPGD